MTIGIIDYGLGNLRSVQKAFEKLGYHAEILSAPDSLGPVGRLVLPGVGAFEDGMAGLRERGWIEPIRRWVMADRPLLGICLGMQLLFEGSEEDAADAEHPVPGLGLLPGLVRGFEPDAANGIKVPHMGWNSLHWRREDPLLRGLPQGVSAYFVHGYYPAPSESQRDPVTTATAQHGCVFTATAWRGRLWAAQFHPEKSKDVGLKMLDNFARIDRQAGE